MSTATLSGASPAEQQVSPPVVVLVAPQLGENIGAAARAMLNCGWSELRLVRPRDGWPNPAAVANSAGADAVLDGALVFETTAEAIGDLTAVFATTARPRHMVKPVVDPVEAARRLNDRAIVGHRPGLLFGGERSGLDNDDVALADTVLTMPLNPDFTSLNLAQAVLVAAWSWRQQCLGLVGGPLPSGEGGQPDAGAQSGANDSDDASPWSHSGRRDVSPAPRKAMIGLFDHLERELEHAGFFKVEAMRPSMIRNLRSLLLRASPTEQEVRTLHGVVTALSDRRKGGAPRRRQASSSKDATVSGDGDEGEG
ncbi:RNA methyltransferase [Fodinicurvata sp. EGI_FJ10296]|uniref:RNA methyltransferase n=1 Tax=Fodinicurvata sp. EGI_FJ10296 TaxID=3231908 RepID=UPI003452A199